MKKKGYIQFISALLLAVVLLFPNIVQFSHIFQGHEHIACNDQSVHMHQDNLDCQIGHFHQVPFQYIFDPFTTTVDYQISTLVTESDPIPFYSLQPKNIQLRAPPHILS